MSRNFLRDFFVAYEYVFGYNPGEMKLESDGILIGMRPIGERDAVAMVFSRDFGKMCGVMRAAQIAKKNRPLVGQVGAVSWNARIDSQLGTFHWESSENLSVRLLANMRALACMNSAFALIDALLPEREPYTTLYDATLSLLRSISCDNVIEQYLNWEICLLRELGYALDLSHCSGCGGVNNLHYLSPKTGRAVCDDCARPYINKVYRLPLSLSITGRFVENICLENGINVPAARLYLMGL
jgi:DNA repair protein RecO (recombination protein O)